MMILKACFAPLLIIRLRSQHLSYIFGMLKILYFIVIYTAVQNYMTSIRLQIFLSYLKKNYTISVPQSSITFEVNIGLEKSIGIEAFY